MSSEVYRTEDIQVADRDSIRRRPAMYIGSANERGIHHLVRELLANALDEARAGFGRRIGLTLFADRSCAVDDDGRGILNTHIIGAVTLAGYSTKRGQPYRTNSALFGLGLKMVAALSEWCVLETVHAGERHRIGVSRGVVDSPLENLGPADRTGVRVRFKPDPEIFGSHTFDLETILHTLCVTAFLNPSVRFTFTDERTGKTDAFHFPNGLAAFVGLLNEGQPTLHEPIRLIGKETGIGVEAAVQWRVNGPAEIHGYANGTFARHGGTHVNGLRRGLADALRQFAKPHAYWESSEVKGEDIYDGLTAVVSIDHPNPQWEGATKSALHNDDAAVAVARVVREEFGRRLDADPDLGHRFCRHAELQCQARRLAWRIRANHRRRPTG